MRYPQRLNLCASIVSFAIIMVGAAVRAGIHLTALRGLATGIATSIKVPHSGATPDAKDSFIVVDDCQELLSPATGAAILSSNFIKNVSLHAPADDPLGELAGELFHVATDGSLDATSHTSKAAAHFSCATAGTLAALVYKNVHGIIRDELASAVKFGIAEHTQKSLDTLARELGDLERNHAELSQALTSTNRMLREREPQTIELRAFGDQSTVSRKQVRREYALKGQRLKEELRVLDARRDSLTAKIATAQRLLDAGDPRIERFSKILARASQAGFDGRSSRDLVPGMLAAFLWKKGHTIADVRAYMDAVAHGLGIEPSHLYTWPSDLEERPFTFADYEDLKEAALALPEYIASWPLDELTFARGGFEIYDVILPPTVDMVCDAPYKGKGFPDCGETSLRNLINTICYDSGTKKFCPQILRDVGFVAPVTDFYERRPTAEGIDTPQAHGDWAHVVSELPGVAYSESRGGKVCVCNIRPGFDNIMKVLSTLCPGVTSLDDLAHKLKKPGVDIDMEIAPRHPLTGPEAACFFTDNEVDLTFSRNGVAAPTLSWKFSNLHFSLTPQRQDDANDFLDALMVGIGRREAPLSFAHACLSASLPTSYTSLFRLPAFRDTNGGLALYALPLATEGDFMAAALGIAVAWKNAEVSGGIMAADGGEVLARIVCSASKHVASDEGSMMAFLGAVSDCGSLTRNIFERQTTSLGLLCALKLVLDGRSASRDVCFWTPRPELLKNLSHGQAHVIIEKLVNRLRTWSGQQGQDDAHGDHFVQNLLERWPEDVHMAASFVLSEPVARIRALIEVRQPRLCSTKLMKSLYEAAAGGAAIKALTERIHEEKSEAAELVEIILSSPLPSSEEGARRNLIDTLCHTLAPHVSVIKDCATSSARISSLLATLVKSRASTERQDSLNHFFDLICECLGTELEAGNMLPLGAAELVSWILLCVHHGTSCDAVSSAYKHLLSAMYSRLVQPQWLDFLARDVCGTNYSTSRLLANTIIPSLLEEPGPQVCHQARGAFLRSLYAWTAKDICPGLRATECAHRSHFSSAAHALAKFDSACEHDQEKRAFASSLYSWMQLQDSQFLANLARSNEELTAILGPCRTNASMKKCDEEKMRFIDRFFRS